MASKFDWKQYLANYPDLTAAGILTEEKAIIHWNNHGKSEGRINSLNFDWEQYLLNYEDLRLAGIDTSEKALEHWINHGKGEKRTDKFYVSIGANCSVAIILKKIHKQFFNDKPTNLFDYVITTDYPYVVLDDGIEDIMKLSLKNVNEILKDNYKFDISDLTICKDEEIINHFKGTSLTEFLYQPVFHKHFISMHDQPVGNDDLTEFNNKLNRRLQRFKKIIKTNKTISFIRYELNCFDVKDYIEFKNIVSKINPGLNVKIYIISKANFNPAHNLEYLKICTINEYDNKNKPKIDEVWGEFDWDLFFKLN